MRSLRASTLNARDANVEFGSVLFCFVFMRPVQYTYSLGSQFDFSFRKTVRARVRFRLRKSLRQKVSDFGGKCCDIECCGIVSRVIAEHDVIDLSVRNVIMFVLLEGGRFKKPIFLGTYSWVSAAGVHNSTPRV